MPFPCPMSAWLRVASLQPILHIFPRRKSAFCPPDRRTSPTAPAWRCPEEGQMVQDRGRGRQEKSATGAMIWENLGKKF